MAVEPSVEDFCSLLVRGRLLAPLEVRNLRQRWHFETAQSGGDAEAFGKWLIEREALTPYQVGMIQRGKVDRIVLNDYKILDRIGQGRMAAVYKAVHLNGQVVALKILPPSKAREPELFARFQREARLALQLKHPNLIRTFQVGECDGLHYIVMEYLEGESLEETLRRRKCLPPAEAAHLLYQALLGLEYLHDRGMVHRDLEPANLMLLPRGPLPPVLKILDIGLGRALFDEAAPALTKVGDLTAPVVPIGSPEYLAPEQAHDPHGADVRSDIYSLGCILYRCLTGRPPFIGDHSVAVLHATEEPAPLRQFNAAVPEELEDIVLQMLEKDPALRFPTPGDAALTLQSFLPGFEESEGQADQPAATAVIGPPPVKALPPHPPVGSDVELVPVAVPAMPADTGSQPAPRKYYYLAIGYGLGAGSMLVVAIIGWKLLLLVAAVVLLWRWKRAWFLAKLRQVLLPPAPVATAVAVPAEAARPEPSIQYAGEEVNNSRR